MKLNYIAGGFLMLLGGLMVLLGLIIIFTEDSLNLFVCLGIVIGGGVFSFGKYVYQMENKTKLT
ncbi:MAG: hypothetical protein AAFO82_06860 [Bacteroidota bacterium]